MSKKKNAADQEKVMVQLAELPTMAVRHLQARYLELFGEATRSRNRDYMVKKLSWRIQEIAEGGLSDRAKARLEEIKARPPVPPRADTRRKRTTTKRVAGRDPRLPKIGTVLTRTFQGAEHRVTVLDEGFEYTGEIHKSLSKIARMITGTSWNGWTFFGLK